MKYIIEYIVYLQEFSTYRNIIYVTAVRATWHCHRCSWT